MIRTSNRWLWQTVFVVILALLMTGLYQASQSINYNWQWHRVLPFIVDTTPKEFRAQGDGTVQINADNSITINLDYSNVPQQIPAYDARLVQQGDLVFEGDVIASSDQWTIGPVTLGLWVTLKISVLSLFFAIILGLMAGLMRISHNPVTKNLAFLYVEIIRGTPLLVQIFIVYFFLGTIFDLERFTAGVVALSIFTGAYIAEIIRAGIQSIPPGQMEAARSLGMSYPKAMMYVILPQAFKRTLPPMAGQLITLIKDSSLVSVISITDLTKAGREVISGSFATFEVWFVVAGLYLLLTTSLSWAVQRIEKRLASSD
ncbi:amino acid ABC transporter permease [Photobacterium sp. WH77]|uniref:amino acid ABC transporter permease n=1 Tax=Photobacterium TaxID=657 RepID=UPI001C4837E3|nr:MULTISPECIES: amino acid ABC transporter permease [Photobacterium]MBV7261665.1 amino acid ABC transporter permease [Photobacterium sp. WH24]MCG2836047.1 amino acid ABC transporter permease [Photobacterium sp. WH77]MCG2843818.1 amino acid ABC transporter permease [Photobacterium sp. WH80]